MPIILRAFTENLATNNFRITSYNVCYTKLLRDHPVAMKELGRLSLEAAAPTPKPDSGKRVAVIGGGPGGLSAAWKLRLLGHP